MAEERTSKVEVEIETDINELNFNQYIENIIEKRREEEELQRAI